MSTGRGMGVVKMALYAASQWIAGHRHRLPRRAAPLAMVAFLMAICLGGCSRLSGDHGADADEQQAADSELQFDDIPESLRAKRKKSVVTPGSPSSDAVVDDSRKLDDSGKLDAATVDPAAAAMPARPSVAKSTPGSRPAARARPKKASSGKKADDIPDAAEIGL